MGYKEFELYGQINSKSMHKAAYGGKTFFVIETSYNVNGTPYQTKLNADAFFKKLLSFGCEPEELYLAVAYFKGKEPDDEIDLCMAFKDIPKKTYILSERVSKIKQAEKCLKKFGLQKNELSYDDALNILNNGHEFSSCSNLKGYIFEQAVNNVLKEKSEGLGTLLNVTANPTDLIIENQLMINKQHTRKLQIDKVLMCDNTSDVYEFFRRLKTSDYFDLKVSSKSSLNQ